MTRENLFPLVFRLVTSLPSRQEQLLMLAEAWLLVAKEDLKAAWRNEEFKEAQARQMTMLDRVRGFTSQEAEVEFQSHKPGTEAEPAIEEASWVELEQLEEKVKRRLAGA
jgi:hypothetical protein